MWVMLQHSKFSRVYTSCFVLFCILAVKCIILCLSVVHDIISFHYFFVAFNIYSIFQWQVMPSMSMFDYDGLKLNFLTLKKLFLGAFLFSKRVQVWLFWRKEFIAIWSTPIWSTTHFVQSMIVVTKLQKLSSSKSSTVQIFSNQTCSILWGCGPKWHPLPKMSVCDMEIFTYLTKTKACFEIAGVC